MDAREPTPIDSTPGPNLIVYWRILVERRGIIASCVVVAGLVGLLVSALTVPRYRAATSLEISPSDPVPGANYYEGARANTQTYVFHQTQYAILESRTVLGLAADRIDLMHRPEWVSREGSPLQRLIRWTRARLTGDAPTQKDAREEAIDFIRDGLEVKPVRYSYLVRVSFLDRDPVLARDVAAAVVDSYQSFTLESRYSLNEHTAEYLTKEVVQLQAEIARLERKLQEYRAQKAIITTDGGTQDISEQALAGLNARLTEARGKLAENKARFDAIMNSPPESLPEVLSSPLITTLRERYADVERRHRQAAERFKPDWPARIELERDLEQSRERLQLEIEGIAEQVRAAARADHEKAAAAVRNLEAEVARQTREVRRVTGNSVEHASLVAEIESRRAVLADLVASQSYTQSTGGAMSQRQIGNIRVVDKARVPDRPALPNRTANLILSLIVGGFLGVGVAFVLDHADNTIKSEEGVRRYSGDLPVLGHVPVYEPLRLVTAERPHDVSPATPALASHCFPSGAVAESFRNLRTGLLLATPDHPPRRILVTSCEAKDGKSTVALNLATVLTQLGRRVLLVDADLRRPRLHRALQLDNDDGLSSLLSGNVEFDDLALETIVPGLDVVTAGPIPPNPSELLDSPRMDALLRSAGESHGYDHVLVDSPPAAHVTDAFILAPRVDATVLVVRSGETTRESLADVTSRLRRGGARAVGTVLNAVAARSSYYYQPYGADPDDETRRAAGSPDAASGRALGRFSFRRKRNKQAG